MRALPTCIHHVGFLAPVNSVEKEVAYFWTRFLDGRNSEICIYGQIVVGLETVRSECVSDVYTRVTKHISSISKKASTFHIYVLVQEEIANIPCLGSLIKWCRSQMPKFGQRNTCGDVCYSSR